MNPSQIILEVIDMRSFSNLWFWIVLAVVWSTASHRVLGVPWDLVLRARRQDLSAQRDVEDLAAISVRRILYILRMSGTWSVALSSCLLVLLGILGFQYGSDFCQAVFLLALPMAVIGLLAVRAALKIEAGDDHGQKLIRRLRIQRVCVQIVGVLSIFVTALWGMYQNLSASVLGG